MTRLYLLENVHKMLFLMEPKQVCVAEFSSRKSTKQMLRFLGELVYFRVMMMSSRVFAASRKIVADVST